MLHSKFEIPLDLVIKPSNTFRLYLYNIFFLATVSIFISTSLPLSLRLLLFVVLLFMMMFIFKKKKESEVTSLKLNSDDEWLLEINNNKNYEAELCGECIVTYFLVWLNFTACNDEGKNTNFHLLLLPDSADKNVFRQLRVRLRFLKGAAEVPESL